MNEFEIIKKLQLYRFSNVISLGFFCSVAQDLEMMGLRNFSSPFDWCWSTWEGVYNCLKTNFKDFFKFDNIMQSNADNCIYADRKNGIISFHDFSSYKSLYKQYDKVMDKYKRRIKRFYLEITKPTLFIRYIWNGEYNNKKANEAKTIENDYLDFNILIKKYNTENQVVFVANEDVESDILPIIHIHKDKNDVVNRKPLFANELFKKYLLSMEYNNRDYNMSVYNAKQKKKNSIFYKIKVKLVLFLNNLFKQKYCYEKVYNHGVYKC